MLLLASAISAGFNAVLNELGIAADAQIAILTIIGCVLLVIGFRNLRGLMGWLILILLALLLLQRMVLGSASY
ncbi:MAG: hypothetical protein B7X08_05470 [Acidocella sp. 20-63-7]|nr:MAG: hypothetical protein B7X08_05470 [Acidocella sp. 20-63-7]